jgi:hypothetical protein
MTEQFSMILVTRSKPGLVERSLYLTFPFTQTDNLAYLEDDCSSTYISLFY